MPKVVKKKRRKRLPFVEQLLNRVRKIWTYFNQGVWEDSRKTWKVGFIKTASLSMHSFLDSNLQIRAASLTYRTILSIVPALALIFAIGRGFGLSDMIREQLLNFLPAQSTAINEGLKFVDSYLNQSSEGWFVGIGIVFLLYTLISLVGSVESSFNKIWNVDHGRNIWRKITDYTAIFIILPVLIVCSSGINIVMSTTLQHLLPPAWANTALSLILDLASLLLIWLFYTGCYMLIPNTKVKFKNALVAGILAGTAFQILEWLFVSGQVYVSRYNAIYGSFAFLPLLLIWLQLVWVITLAGGVVCYSLQNIYNLSFRNRIEDISIAYREKVAVAVMTIIVRKFKYGKKAPTIQEISREYSLPMNLVSIVSNHLENAGLIKRVVGNSDYSSAALVPAMAINKISLGFVLEKLNQRGENNFIPEFNKKFASVVGILDNITEQLSQHSSSILLSEIELNLK